MNMNKVPPPHRIDIAFYGVIPFFNNRMVEALPWQSPFCLAKRPRLEPQGSGLSLPVCKGSGLSLPVIYHGSIS